MPDFAVLCSIDPTELALLEELRVEHYAFLLAHQHMIKFGGPAREPDTGTPEVMIIVVTADDLPAARSFIGGEPYNAHGCFSSVVIRPWSQVLPEHSPGALRSTYDDLVRTKET